MGKALERFTPKSKLDTVVVLLLLAQLAYYYWDISGYWFTGDISLPTIPTITTCAIFILALSCYVCGQKWAWSVLFLFSVYILHEAIFLKHDWQYERNPPHFWLVVSLLVIPPLCLRLLGAATKSHSIDRREFSKVLGAIALSTGIIFMRGSYFPPGIADYGRPLTRWEYVVSESGIWSWNILVLLWLSYAAIAILSLIYTKGGSRVKAGGLVQV